MNIRRDWNAYTVDRKLPAGATRSMCASWTTGSDLNDENPKIIAIKGTANR